MRRKKSEVQREDETTRDIGNTYTLVLIPIACHQPSACSMEMGTCSSGLSDEG